MFLDVLRRRNPALIEAAVALHQRGELPASTYVIDLDAVSANAAIVTAKAEGLGIDLLAMTKQMGRGGPFMAAIEKGGIARTVCVDMPCARATQAHGLTIGHLGHLVQVPHAEAGAAAALEPEAWTVFSLDKAREAGRAAADLGREQALLARIHAPGDTFYPGHEGGFPAAEVRRVAEQINAIEGARFGGITTFPALLFDSEAGEVAPTQNLGTLARAAEELRRDGHADFAVNAPGTTVSDALTSLADAGATQAEPGHALTGTTPLHAVRDLPERPAALYLTEVSHLHEGRAYCFGGGMYIDPVFPPYELTALVGSEPSVEALRRVHAELPDPGAIDYYGQLRSDDGPPRGGESVVMGFRIQAFFTRAYVAGLHGVETDNPTVAGLWDGTGRQVEWPE